VTPEERELQRAFDARSSVPSPEFRARLTSALESGRPVPTVPPALATAVAAVLTVVAVGVLIFAGPLVHPRPSGGPATSARLHTTPTPTPNPNAVPGVLVPPPGGSIALPAYAQLSVPSGDVVWVLMLDQYLYRSTDRGQTWVQRPMPPGGQVTGEFWLPEISFVSAVEGWLSTGGTHGTQCSSDHTEIWHTTDGGSTWAPLGSTGIADVRCKQGLSFVDPRHGFLGAWDDNHTPVIYRTSDGGLTWSASEPLRDPPGFTTKLAGVVQRFGSSLVVPDYGFKAQTGAESVFRSTDGGATWTYTATAPLQADEIAFVSASRWLQLIEPGQSVETTDAGATWHHYASDYSQAAPIAPQILFRDSMIGYATVRGAIELTVDGGLHWIEIKSPGT
jgi:photosystem II stability/assembly factor-like uncharacterized protein